MLLSFAVQRTGRVGGHVSVLFIPCYIIDPHKYLVCPPPPAYWHSGINGVEKLTLMMFTAYLMSVLSLQSLEDL